MQDHTHKYICAYIYINTLIDRQIDRYGNIRKEKKEQKKRIGMRGKANKTTKEREGSDNKFNKREKKKCYQYLNANINHKSCNVNKL